MSWLKDKVNEVVASARERVRKAREKLSFYIVLKDGVWVSELTGEPVPESITSVCDKKPGIQRARIEPTLVPGAFWVYPEGQKYDA